MTIPQPAERREVHHRTYDIRAYERSDGLFDVEARLVDRKPFDFHRIDEDPLPAGNPLHDLSIRLSVDRDFVVREIAAASTATPFSICKSAESTLNVLVGERIAKGWSSKLKEHLRGTRSCTHLMEMLMPMATVAIQGIRGLERESGIRDSEESASARINSCFAYADFRAVVMKFWPAHYLPRDPADEKSRLP